jgi:hypothetical protein
MKYYLDYKNFLIEIFGATKISLTETEFIDNNIVGAIGHYNKERDFEFFTTNFKNRLMKLKNAFSLNDKVLNDIILKSENIAKKKWFGEYSELVAYDFFGDYFELETEITVPLENTFASKIKNRKASSFDGSISKDSFTLTFEVKSLTDIANELLKSLIKTVKSKNIFVHEITVDYDLALDYSLIEENFSAIQFKLNEAVVNRQNALSLKNIDLTFRIHYQPKRIITSERYYSPSNHVESLKYFFLNHFDQVFINDKNLLVYVVHPWFNLINTNDFLGKMEFIQGFSNACFNELILTEEKISKVLGKWSDIDVKVKDIAQRISGILFLFDNNVVKHSSYNSDNFNSIIEGHLFLNPNSLYGFNDLDISCFKIFKETFNKNLRIYGC